MTRPGRRRLAWVVDQPDRSDSVRSRHVTESVPTSPANEWIDIDRYWRAANYLTVGQIYLQDNPLLREPLRPEHIKPRLLGHWGTSPGLNLVYVHLNRLIRERDANVVYVAGPGHGGPAILANLYLEGTYSEVYPRISPDEAGIRALFRQFSTPGGVPSHVSVPTPGSIHEGGELGYSLVHAFGAAFDNPDLVVACVVGDGEAETGPLEGSWKGVHFLNPARDGAVLPILHLNGYKIGNPTVLARSSDADVDSLLSGHGYDVDFVEGDEPMDVHPRFAAALGAAHDRIPEIQADARAHGVRGSAPMAGDRPADAEGLDRAAPGRRRAGGRDLSSAPGPARQGAREPRAPRDARGVDAGLRAGLVVRRRRPPRRRARRARPRRRAADGCKSRTPTAGT